MNRIIKALFAAVLFTGLLTAQGFNVGLSGIHTFSFKDDNGRNQASFESNAPLESISGLSNEIHGSVTFDVDNFKETLVGTISVPVKSIDTGIELRNEHMQGEPWLYAEKYPEVKFEIKSVESVEKTSDNTMNARVKGHFTARGVTNELTADAKVTLLKESERTKSRAPGDLVNVQADFMINLRDYGMENENIGTKVGNETKVSVNIVGSNAGM